jgi:hypothetical protein
MDDPVYNSLYRQYMKEFIEQVFTPTKMNELLTKYHTMITPYVIGPDAVEEGKYTHLTNATAFTSALETLKQHVVTQNLAAFNYLK